MKYEDLNQKAWFRILKRAWKGGAATFVSIAIAGFQKDPNYIWLVPILLALDKIAQHYEIY